MSELIQRGHLLVLGGITRRSLVNFCGPLWKRFELCGHGVVAADPPDGIAALVAETLGFWGMSFIPVPLARCVSD